MSRERYRRKMSERGDQTPSRRYLDKASAIDFELVSSAINLDVFASPTIYTTNPLQPRQASAASEQVQRVELALKNGSSVSADSFLKAASAEQDIQIDTIDPTVVEIMVEEGAKGRRNPFPRLQNDSKLQ